MEPWAWWVDARGLDCSSRETKSAKGTAEASGLAFLRLTPSRASPTCKGDVKLDCADSLYINMSC